MGATVKLRMFCMEKTVKKHLVLSIKWLILSNSLESVQLLLSYLMAVVLVPHGSSFSGGQSVLL